jgi:hypothetical protein
MNCIPYKLYNWNSIIKLLILLIISMSFLNTNLLSHNLGNISTLETNSFKKENNHLKTSSAKYYNDQWIENPSFNNSTESWYSRIEGDSSDLGMNVSDGCANFEILGEKETFSAISDPPSASNWTAMKNPNFPNFPDIFEITDYGCRASHEFNDISALQDPCVHWDQNITLPVNISDYIITSASIQAIVNATVDENLDRYTDYIFSRLARINPNYDVDTYSVGDYIRFYVLISDLAKNKVYEISYFQTQQIGSGIPPGKDYLYDTQMISVSEEVLIFYLTSVLGTDNSHFTITLGIKLHIEDNLASYWDLDNFDEMLIKYVNLTFSYEKKIDRLSSIYWNQIGASLNGNNLEVTAATLNFKYKMDPNWISSLTPNSEMRILINNYESDINLYLNSMNSTFQDLETGGIDVTSFILRNINITLSFQIFIADNFVLDKLIKISIDDVNLDISYILYFEDSPPLNPFLLTILISSLIVTLILGLLSYRAYILMPRKIKKRNYLLLRAQKFKDINNIQALFLMDKSSGLSVFTHSYSRQLKDKDIIFSGFIQAISIIGQEITDEKMDLQILKPPKPKITEQKIIELDLKSFHCLVLDIEDLRTVLVILTKASKRLKRILFNFAVRVYFEIEDQLKKFDNTLHYYQKVIPPFLDEYFELFYKHEFKINYLEKDIESIKKKHHLNHLQYRVLNNIFLILSRNNSFKLLDVIKKMSRNNENLIIDAIESLIEKKIIVPIIN